MIVNIKKIYENAIVPTRGSIDSAGADLYAYINDDIKINPHSTVMIGTGIAVEIPQGYFGAVFARSGIASRRGLRPANCVGVIDSDYRGEIIITLHNDTDDIQFISPNERIAQLVIIPYVSSDFIDVDKLSETERGNKGFGSTGRK